MKQYARWQDAVERAGLEQGESMKRDEMIARIKRRDTPWDIVSSAAARPARASPSTPARAALTLLVEREDFGKGTSSRSTKLVHGGVRYLEQGNISLVMEA
jgi:glycerol-3-phosphate dehydrogenase